MKISNTFIFGLFYLEYKNSAFYWEIVKMMLKLLLILLVNIYSNKIILKGSLIILFLFIYTIFSSRIKPYNLNQYNNID